MAYCYVLYCLCQDPQEDRPLSWWGIPVQTKVYLSIYLSIYKALAAVTAIKATYSYSYCCKKKAFGDEPLYVLRVMPTLFLYYLKSGLRRRSWSQVWEEDQFFRVVTASVYTGGKVASVSVGSVDFRIYCGHSNYLNIEYNYYTLVQIDRHCLLVSVHITRKQNEKRW